MALSGVITEPSGISYQAGKILVARRITGQQGEHLPNTLRPDTLAAAIAIQDAVSDLWCSTQDDSIGGWKCLLPVGDKVIVGPIYTSTINTVAPVALWTATGKARVEPELAFIFGRDLPARAEPYLPSDIDTAIVRTHMALELIQGRYAEPNTISFTENLADGLVNQGLFIGPEVAAEAARSASKITIAVTADGKQESHFGKHPNTEPRAPLYWLVEFLRQRGIGMLAGQAVITGSFAGVLDIPLNEDVIIDYEGLGRMNVNFTAKTES